MSTDSSKQMKSPTGTRLNLGCWVFKFDGWVNIDIDPQFADVVADVNELPYADNSVDEIYAGHILEHCEFIDDALVEWSRVLKVGGKIEVVVPDIGKAVNLPVDVGRFGNLTKQQWLNHIAYGAKDRKEQNHFHIFTEEILLQWMNKFFTNAVVVETDIPWQTKMVGYK